jgi:hypothetical protein
LISGLGKRVRAYKEEIAEAEYLNSKKRPCAFDGTVGPQYASKGETAGDS